MANEFHQSVRHCPLCGCQSVVRLHFQRFVLVEGHPLHEGYWVVNCENCGFVFADIAASQADFDNFYAVQSKYADQNTSTGGGGDLHDAQRLTDFAARMSQWIPNHSARIVDIGCANGGLLVALRQLGYSNLLGVDPSAACITELRSRGIQGLIATLDSLPPNLGTVDAIVLSHVLEHVLDLEKSGRTLRRLLCSDGRIVAEIPDATRYVDALVAPFQEFNTEHINHFSPRSLGRYLGTIGLRPEHEYQTFIPTATLPYPVAGGLYANAHSADMPEVIDSELVSKISTYIHASRVAMDSINERLQAGLMQSDKVLVWGTGQLTMKLLAETVLGQANIAAFVDSNPINHGKHLRGVPILSPLRASDYSCPIVVASTLHQSAIVEQIRKNLALSNSLILLS